MEKTNFKDKIVAFFKRFTWYELALLIVGLVAILVLSIIVKSSPVTILYSVFGVIYTVLLASKFKVAVVFGVIQSSLYIVQSVLYKNWGEVILNSAIVLPILIASVITWFTGIDKKNTQVTKSKLKSWEWALVAGIFVVVWVSFYFILNALNTQNVIIACFSCAFTAAAHYLLLRKSQWMFVAFIGVNVVLFVLWLLPVVQSGGLGLESITMLVTILVYNISNIMGIVNWAKSRNKNPKNIEENTEKIDENNQEKIDENVEKLSENQENNNLTKNIKNTEKNVDKIDKNQKNDEKNDKNNVILDKKVDKK